MEEQNCPYCNRMHFIPDIVYRNIESYGSSVVKFKCVHCEKVIKACGVQLVEFCDIRKTNEESDWE